MTHIHLRSSSFIAVVSANLVYLKKQEDKMITDILK